MVRRRSPATMADLEALPPGVKGEIIEGVLYTQPRPRGAHQAVGGLIADDLTGPFHRGRGGPGGWWILPEPGIELPGSPECAPDLAGWRKERMALPPLDAPITLVPEWLCEIHSPSTRRYDVATKRPYYARIGVGHLWYVDLEARTLTVSRLVDAHWLEVGIFSDDDRVRAEPFDAIEIALGDWWHSLPPEASSAG